MDWESIKAWVEQYGYLAVSLGTLIDQSGLQSFVVAGGVLAGVESRISLLGVILAGAAGSFTSDAILFSIGRWRAGWIERIVKSEKGRMRLEVMQIGMHRWAIPMIAFGRFLPWIGRFMPAAAGLRRVGGRGDSRCPTWSSCVAGNRRPRAHLASAPTWRQAQARLCATRTDAICASSSRVPPRYYADAR
jgi:membrane protein YqaA with SNARE-associated domain